MRSLRGLSFWDGLLGVFCYAASVEIENTQNGLTKEGIQIEDPRNLMTSSPTKTLDQSDLMEFQLSKISPTPSFLLLSQKYHRDWKAKVWTNAKTLPVNGIFQGVLLPAKTQKVKLQFLPFVRYAWIVHVFWLIILMAIGYQLTTLHIKENHDKNPF